MNETLITVFVGLTALAIVIQMAVLIAIFVASRKSGKQLESISKEMRETVLPVVSEARSLLAETSPKLRDTIANVSATSTIVREQAERVSVALNDFVDRARQHAVRADQMTTRALDRVEETAAAIDHAVSTPKRKFSALLTGVMAGVGEFTGSRKLQHQKNAVPREEMFI